MQDPSFIYAFLTACLRSLPGLANQSFCNDLLSCGGKMTCATPPTAAFKQMQGSKMQVVRSSPGESSTSHLTEWAFHSSDLHLDTQENTASSSWTWKYTCPKKTCPSQDAATMSPRCTTRLSTRAAFDVKAVSPGRMKLTEQSAATSFLQAGLGASKPVPTSGPCWSS